MTRPETAPTSAEQGVEAMSDAEIAELARLLEAATPDEWDVIEDPRGRLVHVETAWGSENGSGRPVCSIPTKRKADALFIAAAKTKMSALLSIASEHARLKAENAALRARVGRYRSGLEAIDELCSGEIRTRSAGMTKEELKNWKSLRLLEMPRDIARKALQPAQASADEGGKS